MTALSTTRAAQVLGISINTVKQWAAMSGVGHRNSDGEWRFSDDDMQVLCVVKSLRDDGCGFSTITRRLAEGVHQEQEGEIDPSAASNGQQQSSDTKEIVETVIVAIQQQTDLAEKFARATHQIGRMESDLEHLRSQLTEKDRLLTDGGQQLTEASEQLAARDREAEGLRQELEQARARIADLEARPLRSWLKRWLGGTT